MNDMSCSHPYRLSVQVAIWLNRVNLFDYRLRHLVDKL